MSKKSPMAGKYLTFKLAKEEYGMPITKVKEIIGMMEITQIPQSYDYMKGVINLRGSIIPVIDLRTRFSMQTVEATDRTCIIVVEILRDENIHSVGVVVDSVSEVLVIGNEHIDTTVSFGMEIDNQIITAMAKSENGVKILLDTDKLVLEDDVSDFFNAA